MFSVANCRLTAYTPSPASGCDKTVTFKGRVRLKSSLCESVADGGALGELFLPGLQFSLVSIIPPLLHTLSSIYHPRCIMLFSQYFSFPLSVSFHHCSIPIHPSTTHALQCFSPSTSVFLCQYHCTIAPYPFIHLPPMLYNVFLPVLQFSSVNIIPPLLHTHSFIYHPRCIMFFSQYFSFPLSVSFHHCSIPFHPSTTHAL